MNYNEKPSDVELYTFTPISASHSRAPPLRSLDDREFEKETISRGKEKRVSVSIMIMTFLGSVCILFGTLYPELLRAEVDMVPWRSMIQASVQTQGWLIRDKLTVVNIGLWRYCYDDQLYDLVEVLNPQFSNLGRRRRSAEEEVAVEKREIAREGDIAIRCHNIPEPWKMPYHLQNKKLVAKIALIVGTVTCILSFLASILVMITRLPCLKLLQLLFCLLGVVAMGVAIGLRFSMDTDLTEYFNEAMGRSAARILEEDFSLDINAMGISLKQADLVHLNTGVSAVFIICACFLMAVASMLAELSRNLIS